MLLENFSELKIARRDLLLKTVKGGGALVLSFGLSGKALLAAGHADNIPQARNLDPKRLDTWLAINREGEVTVYWGKMDMGQGVDTAVCQMVAEELDVAVDRVNAEFGDTYLSADQGGASGSSGCSSSGTTLREAAAEARMVLLELASARLNVPASDLTVTDGMIHARSNPSIAVSYGELIGDKLFNVMLEWNGEYGNDLELKSRAGIKDPSDYKVVGTPVRRKDIAGKIIPKTEFAVHVRVPGMLHGRMVRPPSAGAKLISADRSSVSNIPGVQVVVEKDFVGVVAP
jgi:CO/xanthine dehydrogenase Mo-binding subunit